MPNYQITAPDGRKFEITAPDGASEQDVLAYAQQHYAKPEAAPAAWKPKQRTPEMLRQSAAEYRDRNPVTGDMSGVQTFAAGVGKSLTDTGQGLSQLFGLSSQADVDQRRATDDALMNTKAGIAGNITGVGAQMLVPGTNAAKLVSYAGKGAGLLKAGVQGAAFAATQPVATGESRLGNAATGGAFGVAGQGVANTAGKVATGAMAKLSPQVAKLYQQAKDAGIPVHFSQLSDSKFVKTLASTLSYLPFSGGGAKAKAQQEGFNAALGRSFYAQDAKALTDDVLKTGRTNLGAAYDKVFAGQDIGLDQKAAQELFKLHRDVGGKMVGENAAVVRKQIERIIDEFGNGNAIPGQVYQSLRSELRKDFPGGDAIAAQVKQARRILDEAAARALGPARAKVLGKLNGAYANLRTTEDVLKQVAGAQGNVKPSALWPAIRNGSTPQLRELARVGQLLKDPIPDSGTAGRLLTAGMVGGAGLTGGLPLLAQLSLIGATVGRAANSNGLAGLLASGAPNRAIAGVARGVQKARPEVLLPASALVLSESAAAKNKKQKR